MIDESKLVFIISQPRAGSTLLQKLLSNNELVDTVSEPWLLLPLLSLYKPELTETKYNYKLAMMGFFDYLKKKDASLEFKNELKRLLLTLYKVQSYNQYFIDKTPRNYEILPQLMEFFPKAKYIVLKRNPFASLHSMISIWGQGKIEYKNLHSFLRDFLVAPFLIHDFCELHSSKANVLLVNYESIISNPGVYVKEIYQWLNIPFDEAVLALGQNMKIAGLFGDDAQKEHPLSTIQSNIKDAWRAKMVEKEIAAFFLLYRKYLGTEFLVNYGYKDEVFDKEIGYSFENNSLDLAHQKIPKRSIIKRSIHSFLRLCGVEIRKIQNANANKSNPMEIAQTSMSACLANLNRCQ